MTLKDPLVIAIIRGLYTAVGMAALTGLTAFATTNDTRGALITGALAFLGALGFRGGVEGASTRERGRGRKSRLRWCSTLDFRLAFARGQARHASSPTLRTSSPLSTSTSHTTGTRGTERRTRGTLQLSASGALQ